MKKIILAAVFMAIAISASAQFRYGVRAGYSLSTMNVGVKEFSININPGPNHGFYGGPTVEYYVLPNLAISAQVLFQKSGGHFNGDLQKVITNYQQMMKDGEEMSKKNNPDTRAGGSIVNVDDDPTIIPIGGDGEEGTDFSEIIQTIAAVNEIKGDVSEYAMNVPLSFKFTSGKLGLIAGVNLNYTIFSTISGSLDFTAIMEGKSYSIKDVDQENSEFREEIAQSYMELYGPNSVKKTDENGEPTMSLAEFYTKGVAQRFNVGAHIGIEYMFTKNFGLQAIYSRSLMNTFRKPWNDMIKGTNQAIQVGMVVSFP